ncbi:MAG TPA: hypothetical protein VLA72_06630, partial [Anaerolineales bacterium]|nr:hypothetical protein [Anaerolineales bacterium]
MQKATSPLGEVKEHTSSPKAIHPHQRIEILAAKLAQTLKPTSQTMGGNPVQLGLRKLENPIRSAYHYFESASQDKTPIHHAAEWILDNFYIIEQAIRQIRTGMPTVYYQRLPKVVIDQQNNGVARIYALSTAICDFTECSLDIAQLDSFIHAYQEIQDLKIGEIWAFPLMLRFSILERLSFALSNLTQMHFSAHSHLPNIQKDPSDSPQPGDENIVANCILSLRLLATHNWKSFFESASIIEKTLRNDPSGVYARMDFATRNRYRNVIERLALGCNLHEVEIATLALQLAETGKTSRQQHIGYYLIDTGLKTLEARINYRAPFAERFRNWLYEHALSLYLGGIIFLTLLLVVLVIFFSGFAGGNLKHIILAALFAFFPASSITVDMINWLVVQLVPPRILPKLDFQTGIPKECRTIVVIPALLKGSDELQSLLHQLENHYLANHDLNLSFALLSDFADAGEMELPGEQELIAQARKGIEKLNKRYGKESASPFYMFHRDRIWNPGEDCWMGWERKRGKLVEFNYLLKGERETTYKVKIGDLQKLSGIRYVITLDADTVLPRESACRLIGTMAHPLNQACFESETREVKAGYTVLQPRVQVRPAVANQTIFTRVYSGDQILDLYTRAVSDVYQDLFGEGNYVGKGIYDIDAFERSLDGCIPDNHILSHDLFEGIHGRCGLVTDVVLFEDFPTGYLFFSHRLHRWVRGDWQLLPWLLRRVPHQHDGLIPNRLSPLDRWKIIDNLRRNLVTLSTLLLLVSSWFFLPGSPLFWTVLALSVYFLPSLVSTLTGLRTRDSEKHPRVVERREYQPWSRVLFAIIFLPHEALIIIDAILTTLVRLLFTRKRLLQWVTAAHTVKIFRSNLKFKVAWRQMIVAPLFALAVLLTVIAWNSSALPVAMLFLLSWTLSPFISVAISKPSYHQPKHLQPDQKRTLRLLARSTWLYFEHFAGPDDHWLPPDHFQEDPRGLVAHRTSPTNIGLLLLSTLAAYDLGYIGPQEMAQRLENTFDGMDKLEQVRNHWLNWYDTRTLAPLPPRYISTVDSANLAVCLLTLKQGCDEQGDNPVIHWDGLVDTLEVLTQTLHQSGLGSVADELHAAIQSMCEQARSLRQTSQCDPKVLKALFEEDREAMETLLVNLVETSAQRLDVTPAAWQRLMTWIDRARYHIASIQREIQDLCPWTLAMANAPEILSSLPESSQDDLTIAWMDLRSTFSFHPPLKDIPDICTTALQRLERVQCQLPDMQEGAIAWCKTLGGNLQNSKWIAQTLLTKFHGLAQRAEMYFRRMDFGFLFDSQRQVFHIGFNVESGRFDPNYYDLL